MINDKYKVDEKFVEYPLKVLSGEIIAGKTIKLACERYLSWFSRADIYFDEKKAEKPVKFISYLKHVEGKFKNKPFELQDWQKFFVYAVFGWCYKTNNLRVIRKTYLQISRKCGKTSLASALALYGLIADGESGAEVDFVAPSAEQSRIGFRSASNYAESINYGNFLKCLRGTILFDKTKSRIRIMSSDAKFGDGFNSSIGIIDEYHQLQSNDIPNVIESGMGMREQPLLIYITTAGFNIYGPCKKFRDVCIEILEGIKEDDSLFPLIYELDEDDKWDDESNWKKCCPSLGITVAEDYIKQQITSAKNDSSNEVSVKTKTLNIWCQSAEIWINNDLIKSVSRHLSIEELQEISKDGECYIGFDYAEVSDMTAISLLVHSNDDKYYFKTFCYLPQQEIESSVNRELYKIWVKQGYLIPMEGKVTNPEFILEELVKLTDLFYVKAVLYDAWHVHALMERAKNEYGISTKAFKQGAGTFNIPTREFERLIKSEEKQIILDDNQLVRWCINNCQLKQDWNQNVKPHKNSNNGAKIDAVIAMLEALGGCIYDSVYYNADSMPLLAL